MYNLRPYDLIQNVDYRYYLLCKDTECLFQEFVQAASSVKEDRQSIEKIHYYMNVIACNRLLPPTKFKSIKDNDLKGLYEFKHKHIRVYALMKKPDIIIILGGYKSNQKGDIKRFKQIVDNYLQQINKP
ncbi:MAG: hypothetical protein HUK09_08890 [Bacteroidaceae bacterium]|nr:hypothetical protein [Bacteroidaceae bacterium]